MAGLEKGAKYTFFGRSGPRRYAAVSTETGVPGLIVVLACLDPPLPSQDGYNGGGSGEARIMSNWLREGRDKKTGRGWAPGHVTA